MIAIKLIFCATLVVIAYSDFRSRTIPLYTLIFALISGIVILFTENEHGKAIRNIVVNISMITIQLALVTVYFSARNKRFINIFNELLGIGDVLFFLVLALCFSPANMIFFMLISELLICIFYFPSRKRSLIPLAGIMSAILLVLFISDFITQQLQFYSDSGLFDILNI